MDTESTGEEGRPGGVRGVRFVATLVAGMTVADFLQAAYHAAEKRA